MNFQIWTKFKNTEKLSYCEEGSDKILFIFFVASKMFKYSLKMLNFFFKLGKLNNPSLLLLAHDHLCPSFCHTGLTGWHACSPGLETSFTLITVIYAHYTPEAMVAIHTVNQGIFLQWAWGMHFFSFNRNFSHLSSKITAFTDAVTSGCEWQKEVVSVTVPELPYA